MAPFSGERPPRKHLTRVQSKLKKRKSPVHDQGGDRNADEKNARNVKGHLPSIELGIHSEDREDNEVTENESHDPGKGHSVGEEHGG